MPNDLVARQCGMHTYNLQLDVVRVDGLNLQQRLLRDTTTSRQQQHYRQLSVLLCRKAIRNAPCMHVCANACVLSLFIARMECVRWTSSQPAKEGSRSYAWCDESSDEHVVELMLLHTYTHSHTSSRSLTLFAEPIAVPYLAANTKIKLIADAFLCACAVICVVARRFSRPTGQQQLSSWAL